MIQRTTLTSAHHAPAQRPARVQVPNNLAERIRKRKAAGNLDLGAGADVAVNVLNRLSTEMAVRHSRSCEGIAERERTIEAARAAAE